MINILKNQKYDDIIPKYLPKSVEVAHKDGWISGVRHDSGIIFLENNKKYVLVLLSKKLENEIVVCRELTKKFETIYRGTATTLLRDIPDTEYRGEVTLVINKSQIIKNIDIDSEDLAKKLIEYKVPKREIAKIISSVTKEKVNRVYDLIKNL